MIWVEKYRALERENHVKCNYGSWRNKVKIEWL